MKYKEKFKDPRWQKKRLKILERDDWACQVCFDTESTLNVHHKYYKWKADPWDYPDDALISLCEECHLAEGYNRPIYEKKLLKNLKKKLLFNELSVLSSIFENIEFFHAEEVVMTALKWAILDETEQRRILDGYFNYLDEKSKERKSCQETE